MNRYYEEGIKARVRKKVLSACPEYDEISFRDSWRRGWIDADTVLRIKRRLKMERIGFYEQVEDIRRRKK